MRLATRRGRICGLAGWLFAAAAVCGCTDSSTGVSAQTPELAEFVRLVLPKKLQIQRYLTRPVRLEGAGEPDGIEVILQALDSFGDPVKCVGTFHFELRQQRLASSDRLGRRVGFWKLTIDTTEKMVQYWDRLARFYRFPLRMREGVVPPGQYILTATLLTPTGEKLYDEYAFTHGSEAGTAAPPGE